MTDEEHDYTVGLVAEHILRRLDTQSLRLGSPRRQHYKHAEVTIPFSAILTVDDLANAIGDVLRTMKVEFAPWEKV